MSLLLLLKNAAAGSNGGWRSYFGFWYGGQSSVSGVVATPPVAQYVTIGSNPTIFRAGRN